MVFYNRLGHLKDKKDFFSWDTFKRIEVKKDGYKTYNCELRVFGDSETPLRAEIGKE